MTGAGRGRHTGALRRALSSGVRLCHRASPAARILASAAVVAAVAGCAAVPAAFGPTPAAARANADALFGGLANRFTGVTYAPRYRRARELLGRNALTPSRLWNDTTVWTDYAPDGTRTLFGAASFVNGHYVFTNVPSRAPLERAGDGRHIMRLRRESGDVFQWFTGVDYAAGSVTAADMQRVVNAWLASAEGRDGATIRRDYATAFPRTTAALGRLFAVDTMISVRDAAGGNTLYFRIRITPNGIRPQFPAYADYLERYVMRARIRFRLADAGGARWFDAALREGMLTVRLRTHGGHFAPLEGPIRPIPDTLALDVDATARIRIFTVGVQHLVGQWVNVDAPHERGWAMRFTREPDWVLPPTVGLFLRSPLRRPFEGEGMQYRITLRDRPGHQTLLARRGLVTVQESTILRFLGRLGGAAMGDFVSKAEAQENRFDAAVFRALQEDVAADLR